MKLAIFGLGKMGGNMARRLRRAGIDVVGYNRSSDVVQQIAKEDGLIPASSPEDAVGKLSIPRVIWLMLPAGDATEAMIDQLIPSLAKGDIIIDGGNSNYHDSQRRGEKLAKHGLRFADVGTSGGIWGLANGYCLMAGGDKSTLEVIAPALKALAPAPDRGWAHVGPVGAGHFTKMIHNGIEYGMMQAFAEGFALMKGKQEMKLDLAQISELWRHSSVVRSWLLDLTAESLKKDQTLSALAPLVPDSGEGRWTAIESIDQGIPAPVIASSLYVRFDSQGKADYGNKLLALMRNAFGGHAVKSSGK